MSDWKSRAKPVGQNGGAQASTGWKARAKNVTPPEKQGLLKTVGDQFAQGVTFGFGDEIKDGIAFLTALTLSGGDTDLAKEVYKLARQKSETDLAQQQKQHGGISLAANLAGSVATGGPLMKALGGLKGTKVVQALSKVPGAKTLGSVGVDAATGALYGAGTAKEGERSKGAQESAVGSAIVGRVLPAVSKVAGKLMSPSVPKNVQKLLDEKVPLTPGQIAGGAWKRAEDAATSIPFTGDIIKTAQRNSVEGMNRAAISRAVDPLNRSLPQNKGNLPAVLGQSAGPAREAVAHPGVGHDAVKALRLALKEAYGDVLPQMGTNLDDEFTAAMAQLRKDAAGTPNVGPDFETILISQLFSRVNPQTNRMTGESLKEATSQLRTMSKGYGKDPSFDKRQLGNFVSEARNILSRAAQRSNPELAPRLKDIDEAYANYARIRQAASAPGSVEGVFNPNQLGVAVRAQDSTLGKRAFSEGDALMQDLSNAAKDVLPQTVGDSGTPFRSLMQNPIQGALAGILTSPVALPYTDTGRKAFEYALTRRPDVVRKGGEALKGYRGNPALTGNLGDMFAD